MPTRKLSSLGAMVKKKRGSAKLRETAKIIGIGPATLMRVENGRVPDVSTFGKICQWLQVDPGDFLGFKPEASAKREHKNLTPQVSVSAHLKADQTPKMETVSALAKMILLAAQSQRSTEVVAEDEDA
jgi:DNA-binding Xre family transcriptional regulator